MVRLVSALAALYCVTLSLYIGQRPMATVGHRGPTYDEKGHPVVLDPMATTRRMATDDRDQLHRQLSTALRESAALRAERDALKAELQEAGTAKWKRAAEEAAACPA